MIDIVLVHPEIPPNTGNAIRLAANTGARLHLVRPLGFSLDDKQLKRAGLDYHEYARVAVHDSWSALTDTMRGRRMFAFATSGSRLFTEVRYARDLEADAAVARKIAGRGEDQIAGAREAHESLRLPAERDAQARDFRKAARDERGARVKSEAQAIGDAGGDRHHVLHRAADFHADKVGAVIDAHTPAVQQRRRFAREGSIARSERQRAGQAARDFLGERRSRERAKARLVAQACFRDLMWQLARALLEAFAQPDDRHPASQLLQQLAQSGYRRRREREPRATDGVFQIAGYGDGGRQLEARQVALVAPRAADGCGLRRIARPQRHLQARGEHAADRGAPGASAEHRHPGHGCGINYARLRCAGRAASAPRSAAAAGRAPRRRAARGSPPGSRRA